MAAEKPGRLHGVDAAVVALLLVFLWYGIAFAARTEPGLPAPDVTEYVLGVVATGPLLLWRRRPIVAFGLVAGAVAGSLALGYDFGPVMFQLMLATAVLTGRVRGRPLYRVGAGYGVVLIGAFTLRYALLANDPGAFLLRWATSAVLWLVLPAVVGVALRLQREANSRTRAERARRAAAEEQLRIAHEVHDVVGHGLAVIAMQAGAGQHVLRRDPLRAGKALAAIEDTARAALDGLRAELAPLHPPDPAATDSAADNGPVAHSGEGGGATDGGGAAHDSAADSGGTTGGTATDSTATDSAATGDAADGGGVDGGGAAWFGPGDGIADLPRLVERVRGGGVPVGLDVDPRLDPRAVPVATGHAAYRIVQEALTNVLRHGGPGASADVEVRATPTGLVVAVTNTGGSAGEPEVVAGTGIRGMRRRARRLGGALETGHRPGGGFRVSATLPLPAPARLP